MTEALHPKRKASRKREQQSPRPAMEVASPVPGAAQWGGWGEWWVLRADRRRRRPVGGAGRPQPCLGTSSDCDGAVRGF